MFRCISSSTTIHFSPEVGVQVAVVGITISKAFFSRLVTLHGKQALIIGKAFILIRSTPGWKATVGVHRWAFCSGMAGPVMVQQLSTVYSLHLPAWNRCQLQSHWHLSYVTVSHDLCLFVRTSNRFLSRDPDRQAWLYWTEVKCHSVLEPECWSHYLQPEPLAMICHCPGLQSGITKGAGCVNQIMQLSSWHIQLQLIANLLCPFI